MQSWKFAAAARIASAVISGGPDEPDSPLQDGAGCAADGREPVMAGERPSRASCAATKPQPAATIAAPIKKGHAFRIPSPRPIPQYPKYMVDPISFQQR